jgi:hypothetical protein
MTTYPLEFHRRSEQKWALRAQASRACENTPRAALVGARGGSVGQPSPNVVTSWPEGHGCGNSGNGSGPSTMPPTNLSRNVSPRFSRSLRVAVTECPANPTALLRPCEGQKATILTLPTQPKPAAEAEVQHRVAYVG